VVLNVSNVMMLIGIFLGIHFVHKRRFLSLITPGSHVDWKKLCQSAGLIVGLYVLVHLVDSLFRPSTRLFVFNLQEFLLRAPLFLLLTPIQAASEEILCRGYFLQGLGLLTRNRPALVVISGFLFLLLHLGNPGFSAQFLPHGICYFLVGCFLTFVTLRSNCLELAIGVHAGTNLVAGISRGQTYLRSVDAASLNIVSVCIVAMIFYLIMFYNGGTWWRVTSTNHLE
jgi:uncharacterized protein